MTNRVPVTSSLLILASLLAQPDFYAAGMPVSATPPFDEICNCSNDKPTLQFFDYLHKHPLSMPTWHRSHNHDVARCGKRETRHVLFSSRGGVDVEEDEGPLPPPVRPDEVPLPTEILMRGLRRQTIEKGATFSPSAPTMSTVPTLMSSTASGLPRLTTTTAEAQRPWEPQGLGSWCWLGLVMVGMILLFAVAVFIVEILDRVWRATTKERNPRRGRLRLRGQEQRLLAYGTNEK